MAQENLPGIADLELGQPVDVIIKRSEDGVLTTIWPGVIAAYTAGRKKVIVRFEDKEYKLVNISDITPREVEP